MPTKAPQVAIGEEWAYREKADARVVRVRVTRIGTGRPLRVRVFFVGDEFEGREEWVPPARLKVRWENVAHWQEREHRWEAVRDASYSMEDTPERIATDMVLDVLTGLDVCTGYGRDAGVLLVDDVDGLAARLDLDRAELTDDPLSFLDDDGTFVASWAVAYRVARRAATLMADEVVREVANSEAKDRQRAVYGEYHRGSRGNDWYSRPATCAAFYEEWKPAYALVREWCGADAVDRYDELLALRAEVLRVGQIAERAIREAEAAGAKQAAEMLRRELGVQSRPYGRVRIVATAAPHQGRRDSTGRGTGGGRRGSVRDLMGEADGG